MKNRFFYLLLFFLGFTSFMGCEKDDAALPNHTDVVEDPIISPKVVKYLALGDSYTIGQNVCAICRFPAQLKDSLRLFYEPTDDFQLRVIAQTGWTTSQLKSAVLNANLANDHDLITLLIGVNNQYQNRPFSLYEQEFPELVQMAIEKAGGDKNRVIIVSIPDYAFTPFGQISINPFEISLEIDQYNAFAENYALANDITFVNITDITRLGLEQPNLVANDFLHPSELAYTQFVSRILPWAKEKLGVE